VRRVRFAAALVLSLSLVASACGDDGESSEPASTTAAGAAAGGGGAATTAASNCKLDKAPKLVGLFEKKGESVNAIDDFADGSQMAVDEINAAGGVCGQKIEWERLPSSPTDTNQAKNQFLAALDKKANLILGPISSTPILAIAPEVKKAGVPILYMSVCPQCFTGQEAGSEWSFLIRPNNAGIANLQAEYIVKDLNKKKVGLSCVEQPFGTQGCDAASAKIKELGGEVVARETNATTAQDLVSQVNSFKGKGAEAILAFNFPNPLVVLVNQLADNAVNIPVFGGSSAGIGVASGSVKPAALTNLWGTDDCAPAGLADAESRAFAEAFTKKYNKALPGTGYAVAEAYDGVKLAAAAITQAKSVEPKAIADALRTITHKGVCTTYKANAGQGMHSGTVVEQFDAKGIPQVKKTFTVA
jgi:branched-chain amino acid transport system substrate-binding protein